MAQFRKKEKILALSELNLVHIDSAKTMRHCDSFVLVEPLHKAQATPVQTFSECDHLGLDFKISAVGISL